MLFFQEVNHVLALIVLFATAAPASPQPSETIRVGYFPNITHAQALIGLANGTFERTLGPGVTVETKIFNAGPSAIEALFAGAIDLTYIGPGPAINGYVRSHGELRILTGACSGGAALVVRQDVPLQTAQDLRGKKLATPQLGNTQDIAARLYLKRNGLTPVENGGDVQLLPVANADQLTLFLQKRIDAAWAPEPWATRLVLEGKGRVFLDERTLWPKGRFATTVLLVRKSYLDRHSDLIKKWLAAHREVTAWIQKHPVQARILAGHEIRRITTIGLPERVLSEAWSHLEFTDDPNENSLRAMAQTAYDLGFLGRRAPNLDLLVERIKP